MAGTTIPRSVILGAAVFLALMRPALADETRPYSCRLYDDEQRKCAFGSCNKQTLEQLRKDCLIAGGRP